MPKKSIRVCVIGAGRAGLIHAKNFIKSVPHSALVAICEPFDESRANATKELGLETSYKHYSEVMERDDIDAVVVVTPTKYHEQIVVAAAEHGKHILCEKPMAMNVQECQSMIDAVERNKVTLQIGFMRRFDESFCVAKERIDAGEIGDVVLVKSLTHGPSSPQEWMFDIEKSNGPLAEVCSHDIDTLHWYADSYMSEVHCIADNYRDIQVKQQYPNYYDNVIMNCRFQNGKQGFVEGAVHVEYGYDSRVEVLGIKGMMQIGTMKEYNVLSCTKNGIQTPFIRSWRNLFEQAYLKEDMHFVESILNGSKPRVTGKDGMEAVKVVNAGNKSIQERKIIPLNKLETREE